MSLPPLSDLTITPTEAAQLAVKHYGIQGKAKALPGEVDFNFRLRAEDGQTYTLKVSRPDVDTKELDFQASIMQYLSTQELPFQIPEVIPTRDGALRQYVKDKNGQARWLRLQKWVTGRVVDDINPRSPALLKSWGQSCGYLSKALQEFDHPKAHRFYKWNPSETLHSRQYLPYFQNKDEHAIATYFWDLFESETLPQLTKLRKSVNYNDAHELNLLVPKEGEPTTISGIIDFGDALYTHTVNELAIACAYAGMGLPDPLDAMAQVVQGFHDVFPLEDGEAEVLYSLISARLLITVASAAWNKYQEPDNAYLLISERPAWELLKKWREISPALAHYTFRHACGREACPTHQSFRNWIANQEEPFAPLVAWSDKKLAALNLSVGSLDLGNNDNFATTDKFQRTINRVLEEASVDYGVGGYGEVRPFYTTDAYQVEGNSGAQWRTVHLGLDVWTPAGVPVLAPLAGEVVSIENNAGDCNYGPTIILKHQVRPDLCFYTLYGHLGTGCLDQLKKGDRVGKGQQIATIGPPSENGNWPPHLHFQIMLDLLGEEGDFPGVAYPDDRAIWLSICPNPHLLYPELPKVETAQWAVEDILHSRRQNLGKSLSISYQEPLHMVRGFGQYLYDASARRYLDTVNNVAHVGHEHPRVVRAAQRQTALLNTNTRYLHPNIVQFAEELLATFPPELSVVHFVNSGSEANELALRMVQSVTGQKDMIAIEIGYHGNTGGCIDISSYKFDGKGGQGAPPHTHIVPLPDTFRGLYRDPTQAGRHYADHVSQAIAQVQAAERNIAGFIGESIISCGGQIVLPEGYLQAVYKSVREAGGLCIADEVQVGFGRVGEAFWGFELQGVVPDIVTMGKPIGNGHPLAAVVTTQAVAEAFANGMEYFNTFGGNPVSCAVGREVLRVIRDEGLQENARSVGAYLTQELKNLQKKHPLIGDVRGPGLFLGFELVKDGDNLVPAAEEAAYLANRMRERGILMSTDGPDYNVLKIKPPLCFNRRNVDFFIENLDLVLSESALKR